MIVMEEGVYEFLEDKGIRYSSISVMTCPKGMQFTVTQIDRKNTVFYSPNLGDWQYMDQPVKRIDFLK